MSESMRKSFLPQDSLRFCATLLLLCTPWIDSSTPAAQVLTPRLHHLRNGSEREWSHFPGESEGARLSLTFDSEPNPEDWTLRLRQLDVKQTWKLHLNGKELARLNQDENDMVVFVPLPRETIRKGENRLVVESTSKTTDDIRVGEIRIERQPMQKLLHACAVDVLVREAGKPVPCRITIVNSAGSLMTNSAESNDQLAARPGVVYAAGGSARFGLPPGEYTVFAGRGFEYGIDSQRIELKPGDKASVKLNITREVPTSGLVAVDTHVHTLSYSGHGDAKVEEQVIAIAGEGIELPIATEHNRQVDYHPAAVKQKVRTYFTPVIGNEVTTSAGHFNIFPVKEGKSVPDFKRKDWRSIFSSIEEVTHAKVIILNHPRDLHSAFRPFGAYRHLAITGQDLDAWTLKANGVEVINSGAQQSDVMQPIHDWMALLNRGLDIAPVGASDSHDVARYFVGQARTYIRCKDDDPGNIDLEEAVSHFRAGKVAVSCGLLTELTVNKKYGPGQRATRSDKVDVAVRVLGPGWVQADRVQLFANGIRIRDQAIKGRTSKKGVLWEGGWTLPAFPHDVHLVAVASGPGVTALYWPIARPYQPTSPILERRVIGLSGAIWIDGDGNGRKDSAFEYAARLLKEGTEWIPLLANFDEAVALQAASLLKARDISLLDPKVLERAKAAGPHVVRAFERYNEAWRASQIARRESSAVK